MKFLAVFFAVAAAQDEIKDKMCDATHYATADDTQAVKDAVADKATCGTACGAVATADKTKDWCCMYYTAKDATAATCSLHSVTAVTENWATKTVAPAAEETGATAWEWEAGVAVAAEEADNSTNTTNATNDSDSAKIMTASFLATTATLAMVY